MFTIPLWYIISIPIKTFHFFGGPLMKLLCSLNYLILLVNRPSISGFLYLLQNCIRIFLNTIWLASHYCSNISPLILFQSFLYLNGRELTLLDDLPFFGTLLNPHTKQGWVSSMKNNLFKCDNTIIFVFMNNSFPKIKLRSFKGVLSRLTIHFYLPI